ncbi:MAG: iron donor protein CyaY [Thiobacillaceae bacterium]
MKDHSLGMDDKEFASLAQAALIRIQSGLENAGLDFETPGDGILKIDFDDGSKMVINRHGAAQEVWVAARSGGFHFRPTDGSWKDSRDGEDLYVKLAKLIALQGGAAPLF